MAGLILSSAGCVTDSAVRMEAVGPTTFDGLQRVEQRSFEEAWAKPGLELSHYQNVFLEPIEIAYVVSHVPPEPIGCSDIYLRSIGKATLVLGLRDAVTNEILARAIDRCAADRADLFIELNAVTAWSEVHIVAKARARLLRQRLDEFLQPNLQAALL
jgi:hypothetical protein